MTDPDVVPAPRHVGASTGRSLPPQGYRLTIDDAGSARIDAADDAGRFYAEQTLAQVGPSARATVIEDWPDLAIRGVMLDVSRDKVPTMETLLALVDRLASWRINQLQLYIEHTFAYADHEQVWRVASPFTPDEIRDLDAYCRARHIELVPNQNCLGHMERWLAHDRYRPLAIRPDGWTDERGRHRPPTTIDPSNPASLELVRSLLAELLPNFTSRRVHVGLDEPWELPHERFGDYVDYIDRLRAVPELDGREALVWGDIVAQHPERARDLPDGVTICEWGYEANHPFTERADVLAEAGVPFWLCPGTSSWNTLVGRWSNMRRNCLSAAQVATGKGATGYLVTDWGDNGHLQHLPASEPGFAYAASVAWCADTNADIDLDRAVFDDPTGETGAALRELGDAHLLVAPQLPNNSILAFQLLAPRLRIGDGFTAGMTDEDLAAAKHAIAQAVARLDRAKPERADGAWVLEEIRASAELLDLLVDDQRARLRAGGSVEDVPASERAALATRLEPMMDTHRDLWLRRNRPGGLDDSVARLQRLHDTLA